MPDAASTAKFVEQENALTFAYLAKLPGRETIKQQLRAKTAGLVDKSLGHVVQDLASAWALYSSEMTT